MIRFRLGCYPCSETEHTARTCMAPTKCPACMKTNLEHDHCWQASQMRRQQKRDARTLTKSSTMSRLSLRGAAKPADWEIRPSVGIRRICPWELRRVQRPRWEPADNRDPRRREISYGDMHSNKWITLWPIRTCILQANLNHLCQAGHVSAWWSVAQDLIL